MNQPKNDSQQYIHISVAYTDENGYAGLYTFKSAREGEREFLMQRIKSAVKEVEAKREEQEKADEPAKE